LERISGNKNHLSFFSEKVLSGDTSNMEPFRPLVDEKVYEISQTFEERDLNTEIKANLLEILTRTVYFDKEKSPLMVALSITTSSLRQCFTGTRKKIKYPKLWNSTLTE